MNITRYTDYSLRVLIYLAANEMNVRHGNVAEERVTIKNIADSYDISKNHLMKIVQTLHIEGYVLATRGKNGGIKLNKEPKKINIGKLVRSMEQDSKLVECFGSANQCIITPACQLKSMFAEAMESFFKTLEQYSLQDLVQPKQREQLTQLLSI